MYSVAWLQVHAYKVYIVEVSLQCPFHFDGVDKHNVVMAHAHVNVAVLRINWLYRVASDERGRWLVHQSKHA